MSTFYPYQITGASFLSTHNLALLGDEMGLGKSAQVILAASKLSPSQSKFPMLILCPAIARFNWENEFKKWSGVFDTNSTNSKKTKQPKIFTAYNEKALLSWDKKSHLIASYNLSTRLNLFLKELRAEFPKFCFSVVVLDECHFLKNKKADRTKAVLGKFGIAHMAKNIWALSGTPMPNHAGELWVLLFSFGLTALNYNEFVKYFCLSRGGYFDNFRKRFVPMIIDKNRPEKMNELKSVLSKIMLRRTLKEVGLELPPIRFGDDIVIEKPKDPSTPLPADLLFDSASNLDEKKLHEESLRLSEKIKNEQITGWQELMLLSPSVMTLRRYTGLLKVEKLAELIKEELENKLYNKVLIFCIHRSVLNGLLKRLKDFNPVTLHGASSQKERIENINSFQTDENCTIMIANILAAGTAINLTASEHVIFCELDWTPANNAQALKRAHRIGTENSIYVRNCSLENSLDAQVNRILLKKTKDICGVFGKDSTQTDF